MSNLLNAIKLKFNKLRKNPKARAIAISAFALLLVFSMTLAWYINNMEIWGMQFSTGNIDFDAYIYNAEGKCLLGPVSSKDDSESKYINSPLISIENAQVGTTATAYIAVKSTGSIGIQYKIAFNVTGENEKSTAYLGGYKYNISQVNDKVDFNGEKNLGISRCPAPEQIKDEVITIDRNAIGDTIFEKNGYDVYRFDLILDNKNEEYTGNTINIYFNIFATQIGGSFENTEERGYTYYCSTKEDLDRAKVEAYPGDIIKLSSDIVYYGDLVFNKPVNLETNNFTLTVNGNLMYDYVLGNSLKLDAGGLGKIIVQSTKDGVGKAPISEVSLIGSNAATGDIVVEKTLTLDATNAVGSAGVIFNNIRIVDENNTRKTVMLESNTRATVSFGTTLGAIQSVAKAQNIEIVNNGVIEHVVLASMAYMAQTNSPQIYILNNKDIKNPIELPSWSEKFTMTADGKCSGNTRIIQSISGSPMTVTGNCKFKDADIEVEYEDVLVEQIEEGNDSGLKIYYQDLDGQKLTLQTILEEYFRTTTTGGTLNEVMHLEIITIGDKAITNADILFMNSDRMQSLKYLDMNRSNVIDTVMDDGTYHRLPNGAFSGVSKYETLVLPQNLESIGDNALANTNIINPNERTNIFWLSGDSFARNWFNGSKYVCFAASVPEVEAVAGLTGVQAVFVEEAYIESYKSVYSSYANRIYPVSVLDESRQHFVRNTGNDNWEITYYISGEDKIIGDNITIEGTNLKITSVYDNAYRHNFTGSVVDFDDAVENLGANNFYGNKNVTKADLNNLKYVGDNAFMNCASMTEVVFGNYLQTIGDNAFCGCLSMSQEVVLPATMTTIGHGAFERTKITYAYTGGASVLDGGVFASCKELIHAELPEVQIIGEDGANALFADCTSLVSVSMPSLIKVTGDKFFMNCTSLHEIYLAANDDGLSFGTNSFYGMSVAQLKLYVPMEHLEFFRNKRPGNISANAVYPNGEKMGEQLVNGFNIGEYVVCNNGDNTYTLVTSNLNYEGSLVIPTRYNGKVITGIFDNAFRNQTLTDVTLELGNSVKTIGSSAFYGCAGITKVVFGNSLEIIGESAFAYCSNLAQNLVLPNSMKRIEKTAFSNSGITGVNTGGTTVVNGGAFISCNALAYAEFPQVTVIGEDGTNDLFASDISLVSVSMPKVNKVYGTKMFMNCTALREIFMGTKDANITLGSNAFYGVTSAQIKLFVPGELVSFYGGRHILNAAQIYPIGEKMGDLSVNGFKLGDYVVMENDQGYTLVTSNLEFSGTVVVPDAYNGRPITEVYANAFRNQSFTDATIQLGNSVKVIGSGAFYGRSGLQAIVMDQVTTVGAEAFMSSGLKVLNGSNLTAIGDKAFNKCVSLGVVNLPKLERIDSTSTFAECTNLKTVYFENVKHLDKTTLSLCKALEKITINRLINESGDNLPETFTIESAAPCKIYVPYRSLSYYPATWSGKPVVSFDVTAKDGGHTYILAENNGRYTLIDFTPGSTATSLTLPATLTADNGSKISIYAIQAGAFSTVASSLQNITLSNSVAQLGSLALSECQALQNIYVNSGNMFFTAIKGVLYSKDAKMLVKFPAGRSGSFDMTASDYAATVGIGAGAFANGAKLTQIKFPASMMVIDSTAFAGCVKLSTVTFTGATPPVLMGSGIFDTAVEGFQMIVPADKLETYLCAFNFAEYEPFIDLNGGTAPGTGANRNQVALSSQSAKNSTFSVTKPDQDDATDPAQAEPTEPTESQEATA